MEKQKRILDVCCGGRMFWFDKNNPDVLFVDNREMVEEIIWTDKKTKKSRTHTVEPDKVMDFRHLDIPNSSYSLVVFDPPHMLTLGENSWMAKKYGKLNRDTWREDIKKGFSECFRVLRPDGVLIFKWNEHDIPTKDIISLSAYPPLFGHPSGKLQKTHWVAFMK
jgi:SAM-dependent methyltransferase